MNEVAELTVQYVNPPKEGKKWGSIKSSEGDSYFGPPNLLREFTVGEVAKIEWKPFGENAKSIVKKLYNGDAKPIAKQIVRASTSASDAEAIFVNGKLSAFISAGMVPLDTDAIVNAVNKLRDAYRRTLGGSIAQRRDDLNDEIPY